MKKIESKISDNKMAFIERLCENEGYTYAEFIRRALDLYLHEKTNYYFKDENGDIIKTWKPNKIV